MMAEEKPVQATMPFQADPWEKDLLHLPLILVMNGKLDEVHLESPS